MSRNIFTENPDFYPTPGAVIEQMLSEADVCGKVVLEPSAGKGDIVASLLEAGAAGVLACEKDDNIRSLLLARFDNEPDFQFLAADFLAISRDRIGHVDAIIMNPPFSNAADHILHAWNIAPEGCTVVALCNSASLEHNGAESWRRLREEALLHGSVTELGNVFSHAERRTDVAVAMVTLHREAVSQDPFADYFLSEEDDIPAGGTQAGLMPYNAVRDIVNRYIEACRMFNEVDRLSKKSNAMAQYSEPKREGETYAYAPYLPITFGARTMDGNGTNITFDQYCKMLQKYYWDVIFHKLNLEKYSTSKLRQQLNRFIEQQHGMPFTMKNIYAVLDIVIQTNGQRMREALVEAFEEICSFSAENSTAGEKWKTNSDYMVNRKFIVPWMCEGEFYGSKREYVHFVYEGHRKLDDINKALCFVTGTRFEDIPDLLQFEFDKAQWGTWYEWGFFRIKFFKKGTVHCEFLDEDVWMRFNAEVARIKGWALPKTTKKRGQRAA